MLAYNFNFAPVWRNWDKLLDGLVLALFLAAVSLTIGAALGLAAAHGRRARRPWLRGLAWTYGELFRNAPLLLLVYFVFFGLPELGITALGKIESFVLTLSLYAGAYLTEVFRAGLEAVPRGNVDAAKAIGLRPWQRLVHVVWPVMFRISLPALGNNLISLFKDTSLAAAIAVPELTFTARQINANTFRVMEAWLVASGLYLATAYLIAFGLRLLERRLRVVR